MSFKGVDISWGPLRPSESPMVEADSYYIVLGKLLSYMSPMADKRVEPVEHNNHCFRLFASKSIGCEPNFFPFLLLHNKIKLSSDLREEGSPLGIFIPIYLFLFCFTDPSFPFFFG